MISFIRHASFVFIVLACRLKHAASAACGETSNWGTVANADDHAACTYRNAGHLCGGQLESANKDINGCNAKWLDSPNEHATGLPKMVTKGKTYRTSGDVYSKWEPSIPTGSGADNPEDGVLWQTHDNDNTKWTIVGDDKSGLTAAATRWCAQNSDVTDDRHACSGCGTHSIFNGKGKRECRMVIVHIDGDVKYVQFFTENYCDGVTAAAPWYQKDAIYSAKCATRDPKGDECGSNWWESDCQRDIVGSVSSFNGDRFCRQMYYDATAWGGLQHEVDGFCQGPVNQIVCSDDYDCPVGDNYECKHGDRCAEKCQKGQTFVQFGVGGQYNLCNTCPYPSTNANHGSHFTENACDSGDINCPGGYGPRISQAEYDLNNALWTQQFAGYAPNSIYDIDFGDAGMCEACPDGKTSRGGTEVCETVACPEGINAKAQADLDNTLHYSNMENCVGVSCANTPCQNGGTCTDVGDSFSCSCAQGFEPGGLGFTCSQDINECDPNNDGDLSDSLCLNGATCTNTAGSFTCHCAEGYAGEFCNGSEDDCVVTEAVVWVKAVTPRWTTIATTPHQWRFYYDSCSGTEIAPEGGYGNVMNKYPLVPNTNYVFKRCSTAEGDTQDDAYFKIFKLGDKWMNVDNAIKSHTYGAFTDGVSFTTGDIGEEHRAMQTFESWNQDKFATEDFDMRAYFEVTDSSLPPKCSNGGVCADGHNSFSCECAGTGYDGSTCTDNINECTEGTPCDDAGDDGAVCVDTQGNFTCTCTSKYEGDRCEIDINECTETRDAFKHACQNGVCINEVGGYLCDCSAVGYTGSFCEVDKNECDPNGDENYDDSPCDVNAVCENTDGSYTCTCNAGWQGEGHSCADFNECDPNNDGDNSDATSYFWDECLNGGTCVNVVGNSAHGCDCPDRFTGPRCYSDKNECDTYTYGVNECAEIGSYCSNIDATSNDGDYTCTCKSGFQDVSVEGARAGSTCQNIDDCQGGTYDGDPCLHGGLCVDHIGYYTCNCAGTGFENNGADGRCENNIDDCGTVDNCNGHGTCTDGVNSATCACNVLEGTTHAVYEGLSCQNDVDECATLCNPSSGRKECTNSQGGFECKCKDLCKENVFVLGSEDISCGYDGLFCEDDINECTKGTHDCHTDANCVNTQGAWQCTCKPGYFGNGTHCREINECTETLNANFGELCVEANMVENGCTEGVNTRTCACKPGYEGARCQTASECQASDEPSKNGSDGQFWCGAHGTIGGITGGCTCTCAGGYKEGGCETDINECDANPCKNGAACTESDYGNTDVPVDDYSCACTAGWEGKDCDQSINDCLRTNNGANDGVPCAEGDAGCASPCKHNSPCADDHLDYSCDCDHETAGTDIGWEGKQCHVSINNCIEDPCCDTNAQKHCTDTTAVTGAVCMDGYTENGVFNHNYRTCNCANTNPPMYGDSCQLLIIEGCMDDEKINYDPLANHDNYDKCEEGDAVYDLDGFKDRGDRLEKWKEMQERKYTKTRTDGLDYSDKSKRKQIRKADRIVIKNEDYLNAALSKLNTIGFGARPKRLEVGSKNKDETENCAGKVLGGGSTMDFVGDDDDCVTTVLDDEEGEGDQKTLTRRALPDEPGSWQVIGKTIEGDIKPIIKQVRTDTDAYTMSCWEDNQWTQETQGLSEGMDFLCAKTRHRVLVGSVTDYPAPCEGLLNNGCTSEQKTEAYLGRSDGFTDCSGVTPDPDRDIAHNEADTAECKTLGCTTQQIVDSFTCS